MKRILYLVAYDISNKACLRHMHQLIQPLAVGNQKSAYECWLSAPEKQSLIMQSRQILADKDRLLIIRLINPHKAVLLGKASHVPAYGYLYIG